MIGRVAAALAALAVLTAPAPPSPPPVLADIPAGAVPGPAPGLRLPERCAPPPEDTDPGGSPGAGMLRLAEVRLFATGRGQLIAVIDTGVAPHPRLADRLIGGGDYLTGGDGLDDCDGHGTAVAGLLAATPGPDGLAGIAPGARLLSIRQSSSSATVPGPDEQVRPAGDTGTLAEAVVRAVRVGATVVNISEAGCVPPERAAVAGAGLQAALRFAARSDVVVVAAAGNAGAAGCGEPGAVSLPGWYDAEVLTVGAVGPGDRVAPFTVPGPWVDVAAPGTGLRSLAVGGGTTASGVEGTSFAAPWVAGLAALVRERFPGLTAAEVVDHILATARPASGPEWAKGHGVIDPVAALTTDPAALSPPRAPLVGATPAPPAATPPAWPAPALAVLLGTAAAAMIQLRRGAAGAGGRKRGSARPASPGAEHVHGTYGVGQVQHRPRR